MVAPLERGEADAVFGSRMIDRGRRPPGRHAALQVRRQPHPHDRRERGRRHSTSPSGTRGYRAYGRRAAAICRSSATPTASTSTPQIILQLHRGREAHRRDPDPDLLRRRDLLRQRHAYARDVTARRAPLPGPQDGLRHRRAGVRRRGVRAQGRARTARTDGSSRWLGDAAAGPMLDLGCSDGAARRARCASAATTSSASTSSSTRASRSGSTRFVEADLDHGHPAEAAGRLRRRRWPPTCSSTCASPSALLADVRALLAAGRLAGRQRPELRPLVPAAAGGARAASTTTSAGILDRGHLRFFTRRSFERLLRREGSRYVDSTAGPALRGSDVRRAAASSVARSARS